MNITDMSLYRLNKQLDEIADCMGVDKNTFKGIIVDIYLKGHKDGKLGRMKLYHKLIKLKEQIDD